MESFAASRRMAPQWITDSGDASKAVYFVVTAKVFNLQQIEQYVSLKHKKVFFEQVQTG
ncbi:hypothetical protein [Sporomusa paucivorans]|uniref:hypothetical protein n=1 Tax=Sporomusa paucivorans TaxID=2376 RepID=UPI003570A1EC